MDHFDETVGSSMFSPSGCKKKRKAETYSCKVVKKGRYSAQGKVPSIACKHNSEKVCRASTSSTEEVTMINRVLSKPDKVKFDHFFLNFCMLCFSNVFSNWMSLPWGEWLDNRSKSMSYLQHVKQASLLLENL